ncbi:creatininase family protein [Haloimpatiens sp. FM7330]|uniref:creatininase family protein n=1 Tax=Haloimpatiens sp. FM7330 TaxID=3298610 RepID=UPI0036321BD1
MYLINYTSDEFKRNILNANIAIIPIGSVEAHGHHLPLGTDIFSPRLFCEKINDKLKEEVWILPEIPYGYCYDMSSYPGTITIPSEVLSDYIYHIGKSLVNNKIKKIIFMNGHGGNITAINLASQKLVQLGIDVMTINWWLDFSNDILSITEGQGHAGEDETSAILHYDENLVDMSKALKNPYKSTLRINFKNRGKIIYQDALSGDATLASKEKGEKIFNILTNKLIEIIHKVKNNEYYTCE